MEEKIADKEQNLDEQTTVGELKKKFIEFRDKRDWKQYHLPKDVALALSIESSEILEHFRFKTHEQILEYLTDDKNKKKLSHELADVLIYLLVLANETDIDLTEAFHEKQKVNETRYPVEVCKGKPNKYTDYEPNPAGNHKDNNSDDEKDEKKENIGP